MTAIKCYDILCKKGLKPNTIMLPSKYKKEYCELRIKLAKKGMSIAAFCSEIGIGRTTYYDWLNVHPELREADGIAYEEELLYFEKRASALCSGQKIEGFDPKYCNPRMLEFKLRTRFHREYSEKKHIEVSGTLHNQLLTALESDE